MVGSETAGEAGEGAAGVDGGELGGVTDEDQLRSSGGGVVEEPVEVAGADHPGLVDDHDVAGPEVTPAGVEVTEEPVQRGGGDPGPVFELLGGSGGEGAPDDGVAACLPGVAGDSETAGLARPGHR